VRRWIRACFLTSLSGADFWTAFALTPCGQTVFQPVETGSAAGKERARVPGSAPAAADEREGASQES